MPEIKHKRSAPLLECGGNAVCEIELVGTPKTTKAKKNEKLAFKRLPPAEDNGFEVTIENLSTGVSNTWDSKTTDPLNKKNEADIKLPQDGYYKYSISYKDAPEKVVDLDPIIIIQPPSIKTLIKVIFIPLLALIIGAWFGMNFM